MKQLSTAGIGIDEVTILLILLLIKYLSTADIGIDEVTIYC